MTGLRRRVQAATTEGGLRAAALALAAMGGVAAIGCGPAAKTAMLPVDAGLGSSRSMPFERAVRAIPPPEQAVIPLVVILDDGPPVDGTLSRVQARTIDQLVSRIIAARYAVWRPWRNGWPPDSVRVHCPDKLADQLHVGLRAARRIDGIDSSHVVLVGFGQGGVIATMVASRAPELVYALAIIGTPARSVDQILTWPEWRDSVSIARLRPVFADLRAGAYADSQIILEGRASCWRSWLTVTAEMPERIARLSQPVLAVQGTADSLLSLLDIERFRRAIGERPASGADVVVGMRHDLRDKILDSRESTSAISPRFVPVMMSWLARVAPMEVPTRSRRNAPASSDGTRP